MLKNIVATLMVASALFVSSMVFAIDPVSKQIPVTVIVKKTTNYLITPIKLKVTFGYKCTQHTRHGGGSVFHWFKFTKTGIFLNDPKTYHMQPSQLNKCGHKDKASQLMIIPAVTLQSPTESISCAAEKVNGRYVVSVNASSKGRGWANQYSCKK